jgi:trans-aconitate 2-methyltransferase
MTWNPTQYERFKNERSQPFFDLLATITPTQGMRAVDLGCGTGELTHVMHERFGCVSTVGYDSSPAMLARAPTAAGLSFVQADIADLSLAPGSVDLVLANASLHWVPDHPALFARLVSWLAPGGQLAVQMPANHGYATHTVARMLAARAPYAEALGGWVPPTHVLDLADYAVLLHKVGLTPTKLSVEAYMHLLDSKDSVIEWAKGSVLTALEARLDDVMYASYLAEYREEVLRRLPDDRPFLYPFLRTFLCGRYTTAR